MYSHRLQPAFKASTPASLGNKFNSWRHNHNLLIMWRPMLYAVYLLLLLLLILFLILLSFLLTFLVWVTTLPVNTRERIFCMYTNHSLKPFCGLFKWWNRKKNVFRNETCNCPAWYPILGWMASIITQQWYDTCELRAESIYRNAPGISE